MGIKDYLKRRFPKKSDKWQIDIATRYLPIVKKVKNLGISDPKILEVGSGPTGITPYLKEPVVGIDISFTGSIASMLKPLIATATDLPFRDEEFDFVISVDMLEHVPGKDRNRQIEEMMRVARSGLVIAVPVGRLGEMLDSRLDNDYLNIRGERYAFLTEHVKFGLPRHKEIRSVMQEIAEKNNRRFKLTSSRNANIFMRYLWMRLWISKKPRAKWIMDNLIRFSEYYRCLDIPPAYRRIYYISFEKDHHTESG